MAPATARLWDVVEEHLDEAEFLFGRWSAALESPRLTPQAIADGVEDRLLANLGGLTAAGVEADGRLLGPALMEGELDRRTVAAIAMLEGGGLRRIDAHLGSTSSNGLEPALGRALSLARRPGLDDELLAAVASGAARWLGPGLEALAFRQVPVAAEILYRAAGGPSAYARAAAVRAARWAGPRALALVERELGSPDVTVRDAAIESGLVLGLRAAWTRSQELVASKQPGSMLPLLALALSREPSDHQRLVEASRQPPLRKDALFALGASGLGSAVTVALEHLRSEEVGRLAAEAISAVTGLAVRGALEAKPPPPPSEPIPFEQEDLDADLVPGAEAELPTPDADAVERWWAERRHAVDASQRHVGGRPHDAEAVKAALSEGPMRWRHAHALELAVRSRGEFSLQSRGWAFAQLEQLSTKWRAWGPELSAPFGTLLRT